MCVVIYAAKWFIEELPLPPSVKTLAFLIVGLIGLLGLLYVLAMFFDSPSPIVIPRPSPRL
jgi:hypothetical protein